MRKAKIVDLSNAGEKKYFYTTRELTAKPQRETLEETIQNLAGALGYSKVAKKRGARGGSFYSVTQFGAKGEFHRYQSASNIILELSVQVRLEVKNLSKNKA